MIKNRISTGFLIVVSTAVPIVILLAAFLSGCGRDGAEKEERLTVAVSIVPQKTFVEAVCGQLADVVVMIPPGYSPENYEPTPKEMERLSRAKIYFAIGVPAESENILPMLDKMNDLKVVRLHEEVAEAYPDRFFSPGERDPHIWLSPKRVIIMIEAIAREMARMDEDNRDTYMRNAREYMDRLAGLDNEIKSALEKAENKKIIVLHPAFGYLADDYGLEMLALEEEGKEASPKRLQEMIELAKRENIKAIFYQAETSGRLARSFAEEIGGRAVELAPLAEDYIENMKKMAKILAEVNNEH